MQFLSSVTVHLNSLIPIGNIKRGFTNIPIVTGFDRPSDIETDLESRVLKQTPVEPQTLYIFRLRIQ